MKATILFFVISCFTSLLSTTVIAATAQISGDYYHPDAYAVTNQTGRTRFNLGNNWSSGDAKLTVVFSYADSPIGSYTPVGVGLAGSENSSFMQLTQLDNGGSLFDVNTLNDAITPGFVKVNYNVFPPSAIYDASNKTLTFTFNPILQNGVSYYFFTEIQNPMLPTDVHYTATLSQVPLPSSIFFLSSALFYLVRIPTTWRR